MQLKKLLQNAKNVDNDKKPFNKQNHIGIEIECIVPTARIELALWLTELKLDKYVTLKSDGSIEADDEDEYQCELAIIAPEKDIYKVLLKVYKALREVRAWVNESCGLHIHIDMRNRDKEIVFVNLARAQNLLYGMNPSSRWDNNYCPPVRTEVLENAMNNRYGINPSSLHKHGTIEVRIHSGTTNYIKISNWIKLLLKIANKKKVMDYDSYKDLHNPNYFFKKYRVSGKLKTYVQTRMNKFKKKSYEKELPSMVYHIDEEEFNNNEGDK